jgi:hypothetical protein
MSEIDRFFKNMRRGIASARQAQLRFVTCKEVNWDERTMTAVGMSDDLEYYGVQLGFGYTDIQPARGSVCLIGILEGLEAYTFLINAEKVELAEIASGKIVFNGGENEGWVKVKELTGRLNAIEKNLNELKQVFSSWVAVPNDGGAALKTASVAWAGKQLTETRQADIENGKVTH